MENKSNNKPEKNMKIESKKIKDKNDIKKQEQNKKEKVEKKVDQVDIKQEIKKEVREESKIEKPKTKKKRVGLVVLFTLLVLIIAYIIFRGNYLETLEIGENYVNVFWYNLQYKGSVLIGNFLVIFFLFYYTNLQIKKGLKPFFEEEGKNMPKLINKSISFILATVISVVTSDLILEKAMLCFSGSSFGINDPIFGLDIGYFVFQKPFIELVLWYIMIAIAGLTAYSAIYYITSFNMFFDGIDRKTLKNSKIVTRLTRNIMLLAIVFGVFVFVGTQDIVTDRFITLKDETTTYSLFGAGFTDVTIKLWGYRILSLVVIGSVFFGIKAFKKGKTKQVLAYILVVPIYLLTLGIVMVVFQAVFVGQNEFDKEKNYIQYNIDYTKKAYGINIEEISLEVPEDMIEETINYNKEVVNNIAIVGTDITLKDLKSSQTAKGYYTFRDVSVGNYIINGKNKLVYVTPREIVSGNGTYNNKTYEYTHGYGVIITSATAVKENGNLDIIQKSFDKTDEVVTVVEPRIYFGMQTNDTVVTKTSEKKEFDYPILDSETAENIENVYDGEAGLKVSFIDRIILAIKERDLKLAFSSSVTEESKILTNRNVIKRAQAVMPYLKYDENPYMVISEDGRLVWVLDAYTISNNYPYSQMTSIQETPTNRLELNYIRNSVKVLIDAYDGTTTFYITDRTDPIAMAYNNLYPNLFASKDEQIPADISSHFVYSEYLYNIQADMISRYHNVQPDVLYRSDDIWEIGTHNIGKTKTKAGTQIDPYYTMVKTIEEDNNRLGLVLPYTPYGKQNLISYLIGSCDNGGSSTLKIYKYSADSNILGPMQLDNQIEQDEKISKEIEALNITGTKLIKNTIIVPINHSVLYVEPIYLQDLNEKDSDAKATLKKVVVALENKVAIGDNLKEAFSNLLSTYASNIEIENTDNLDDLINAIIKANNNLSISNNSNDWEMVGKDIKRLQELIVKLQELTEENAKKNNEKNKESNALENVMSNEI